MRVYIIDCGRELIHVLIRPVPICSHSHSGYIYTGPTYIYIGLVFYF